MYLPPELELRLANERRECELCQRLLIRRTEAARPPRHARARVGIGNGLVRLGRWLAADGRTGNRRSDANPRAARWPHAATRILPQVGVLGAVEPAAARRNSSARSIEIARSDA